MAFDPTGYGMLPPPPLPPRPAYFSAVPYLNVPTIPNAYPSSHSSCFMPNPPPYFPPPPPSYAPPPNLAPAQPDARSPAGRPARDPYLVLPPKDWCPNWNQFHGKCEVLAPPPAGCEPHVPSYWCPAFYSLTFTKLAQWHEWSDGASGEDLPDDEHHGNNRAWTFKWSSNGGYLAKCPLITVYQDKWLPSGQEFHGQCEMVAPTLDGFIGGPFSCPAIFALNYWPLAGWTEYPNKQVHTSPDDGSKEEDHISSDDGSELNGKENPHGSGALPDMNLPPPAEAIQLQQMSHFIEEPWLHPMAEDWFGYKSNPVYRQNIDFLEDAPAQEPALDPYGWFSESRLIAEVEKLSDQLLLLRSSNEASELMGKQDEDAVNRAMKNLSACIGYNLETDTSESETSESTLDELEETGSTFSSNLHQNACRISDPKSEDAEVPAPDSAGLSEETTSQIGSDIMSKMLDEEHISSNWEHV